VEQLEIEQLQVRIKQDYEKLLDLFANIINKVSTDYDISDGERLESAHALAFKFFGHALSVLYLSHGTNQELPSLKWHTVDFASIDVITRAALEGFLVFHHVFYATANPEEKDYRYWAYKAEGLANRQNILESTGSEEEEKELLVEKKELDDRLESNQIFQSLSAKQKRQIFKGNSMWRWKPDSNKRLSLRDIGIEAEFSKFLASHIYNFLSASAHSTSIGVQQTFPTLNKKEEEHLFAVTVVIMNIITANLIREYCELFSRVQIVLNNDIEKSNLVREWIQKGRTLYKLMGKAQEND